MGRLDVRRATHARRAIAALAGFWLAACGVLGLRHEADAAHVVDAHGEAVHVHGFVGQHTGSSSDLHAGLGADAGDPCAIVASLRQPAKANAAGPQAAALVALPAHVAIVAPRAVRTVTVFRIAPKTSPPAAA